MAGSQDYREKGSEIAMPINIVIIVTGTWHQTININNI